jgi:hypothetical protein
MTRRKKEFFGNKRTRGDVCELMSLIIYPEMSTSNHDKVGNPLPPTERNEPLQDMYAHEDFIVSAGTIDVNGDDDGSSLENEPMPALPKIIRCVKQNDYFHPSFCMQHNGESGINIGFDEALSNEERTGIQLMQESIATSFSLDDKKAYTLALELVPHLVHRESNARFFLQCEKLNPWAATKRLLQYWQIRLELFGPSRAFLPMTLQGAMAGDDQYLRKGFCYLQPRPDRCGRTVLFYDRIRSNSRSKQIIPPLVHFRCFFYTNCMAAARVNDNIQKRRRLQREQLQKQDQQQREQSLPSLPDTSRFGIVMLCNCRVCVWEMKNIIPPTIVLL